LHKELSDTFVVFGFVLMEMALVFDWVSGTSGGATYENSPFFVLILLANLLLAHAPVSVTNYLSFAASLLSVVAYLSGMVLAIVSWWRRWVSSVAGCLVMTTVGIWLALFLSLSPVMDVRIDSGLYVAAVGGLLLIGAYAFGRGVPPEGDASP
jgi:hypothetical protein